MNTATEIYPNVFVLDPPKVGRNGFTRVYRVGAFSAPDLGTVLQPIDFDGSVRWVEPIGSGKDTTDALKRCGYVIKEAS